jgi:predicted acyl esterase
MPAAASPPPETDYSEAYFRSSDGTTLHADVVRPHGLSPGQRTPVLLEITPYNAHAWGPQRGGDAQPPPTVAPGNPPFVYNFAGRIHAYQHGYSTVVVDLPGFGASGGCWDFMGPAELAAVKSSVEWAASRPWSSGKVAVVGQSYNGMTGVMALATHPRGLGAVVPIAPVVSLYRDAYDDGVPRWGVVGYVGADYLSNGLAPGLPGDQPSYWAHYLTRWLVPKPNCIAPETSEWLGTVFLDSNPNAPYWRARDLLPMAAQSRIPVFASQGFLDFEVPPATSLALFSRLHNLRTLWLGQYQHDNPVDQPDVIGADAAPQFARFLDATLKGERVQPDPSVIVQEAPDRRWRAEHRWPPPDAHPYNIPVRPARYVGTAANMSGDNFVAPPLPLIPISSWPVHGQGSWTFTQPLPYEIHLAGAPTLQVRASGPASARLVALLYDVAPDGTAFLISRAASLLQSGQVNIPLYPQDWRLTAGHRLGLLLTGADDMWWMPDTSTIGPVQIRSGTLTIPALRYLRNHFLPGGPGTDWRDIKRPIQIDPQTIEQNTITAQLPPREVQPSHVRSRHRGHRLGHRRHKPRQGSRVEYRHPA